MSYEHPIIAVTGSSGAGSSSITRAFEHIFRRERVRAVYIQGSAFHRYDRDEMRCEQEKAKSEGRVLVKRKDGTVFMIQPVEKPESPLDVEGINLKLTADEIVGMVREIRRR